MTDSITITGNLAAEPEQRTLPGGATVTNFRVGSTHRRYDKATEQWVDSFTNWYQVSAFRALGENAFASLHKGDRVIVAGRLRLREWENGAKRGLAVELDADAVGHDLLWGHSTFHKTGSPRNGSAEQPTDAPGESSVGQESQPDPRVSAPPRVAATDGDGWAIPAAPAAPDPEPQLADAPF
ncbi:single-stranded DNA-binding protein [Microbacterium sp. P06]|uniref:single-stranded DNA-binding protein n=1 Tax=Microbacterium sp. P06 TaxID=3366949 RepID=UPI003746AF54